MEDFFEKEITTEYEPLKKETVSPFTIINYLTVDKKDWDDLTDGEKNAVNVWWLMEWLSNIPEYVSSLNQVQQYILGMDKEYAYKFFLTILPKANIRVNWNKADNIKQELRLSELIADRLQITKRMGWYYYRNFYNKEKNKPHLIELVQTSGLDIKEEKKLLNII